jgi:hypothetical protein
MPILKRIPVTPSLPGIGGCQLWLDAGDTSSMTLSSSSVTQWNDKSGNARHYTTLGTAPVYSSAAGGSVTFSQGQALQNSATWSGNGAGVDIFIVTTPWLNTQYNDWRTLFRGANAGHRVIILYNGTSFGYYANNGGGFFQYGSLTLDNTKTLIYVKTDSSFVTSAAFNGNFALSAAGSTQDSDANPFYCLGAYQGGPSQAWGTINEVIIFSNLAAPERQQVEGYLANKWALGSLLPIGHAGKKDRMTLLPGGPTSRSGQIRLITPIPPIVYTNFLWTRFYNITSSNPSINGPGSSGWGSLIGTAGAYNPINFQDGDARIGQSDTFAVISKGFMYSATTTVVTFRTVSDDGVVLYFNGSAAISNWTLHGDTTDFSASVTLPAGYTPIELRFFEWGGGATCELSWSVGSTGTYVSEGTGVMFYNDTSLS